MRMACPWVSVVPRLAGIRSMRIQPIASVLVLSGVLAGCTVGPSYQVPGLAMPVSFVAPLGDKATPPAASSVELSYWWKSLRDRKLDSLIDRGLRANLHLKIALERLQQARRRLVVIASQALPEVHATGGGGVGTGSDETRGRVSDALRPAETSTGLETISGAGGLGAQWELDFFGKVRRQLEGQTYDAEALHEARNWVFVTVAADIARLYLDMRARQQRLVVLRQNIGAANAALGLAQTRLDRGLTNELDATLAKRQVATLQADLAPLAAEIESDSYAIAVLLGEYPEALAHELREPGTMPVLPARIPVGLPVDLLRRRPDIREAERRVAAATAAVGAATADLFPSVILTGGGGGQGGIRSSSAVPVTWIGSVGPSVYWPVLDFGALDARIDIADSKTRELLESYKQTILTAVQQVDEANASYRGFQKSLRSLDSALAAARQATKVATERYDRGLSDFLNVLDAERQQFELEQRRVDTQRRAAESLVAVYKALGGGWSPSETLPPLRTPDPAVISAIKHLPTLRPIP
jgi:NodT family efflux transporter outer membrane factor (OMF) lipoprotein